MDIYLGAIEPNPLPCMVIYKGIPEMFAVLLHDVRVSGLDFNKHRLLHMEEDGLVFGTIEAEITGHILEHFREESQVEMPTSEERQGEAAAAKPGEQLRDGERVGVLTGRTKGLRGYQWKEQWLADGTTGWVSPVYSGTDKLGCGGIIGGIFSFFLLFAFLAAIGPQGILTLLLLAAVGLVVSFFSILIRPLLWILMLIMVVTMIWSLTTRVVRGPLTRSVVFSNDRTDENSFVVREQTEDRDRFVVGEPDSLIVHHRVWKDYVDSVYEGDISIRASDMAKSGAFKAGLAISGDALRGYDRMLGALASHDSSQLFGIYRLLDSVRAGRRLNSERFAEVIVAFVQDIPYTLILDRDCDPQLYKDAFTRRYLESADANCEGFQRFGINTPTEFMGTLAGDCDTRTLLLYTLLTHYGYDAAILSSELYSHSLLGVVLPAQGLTYAFHGKNYVLWETTTPNMPPGIIGQPFNNLSDWRVSLTSNK